MHTAIADLEQAQIRPDIPEFRPGDTLKVHVRVVEGSRTRIQVFQGVVIRRQGGGARETFTVRKISYGVGWSGPFRFTARRSTRSRWSAGAGSAGPSCTISGRCAARLPGLGSAARHPRSSRRVEPLTRGKAAPGTGGALPSPEQGNRRRGNRALGSKR